jgi:glycosyltransferase involved in cell wall biosynthesis
MNGLMKVSLIIPCLNEAPNLPFVLGGIPRIPDILEVLLVDGGSSDNSVSVAQMIRSDIRVIEQCGRGKGDAILTGAREARGEWIMVLDADGSHRPEEITSYIAKIKEGYDLVKGSRYLPEGGTRDNTWDRALLTKITYAVANFLWGTKFTDIGYGMFIVNRQKFLDLSLRARRLDLEYELMIRAVRGGWKILEIPSLEERRQYGRSHLSYVTDGWLILKTILCSGFSTSPGARGERCGVKRRLLWKYERSSGRDNEDWMARQE